MPSWLKRLRIGESSVVDYPANPGARMPLFKRDATKGGDNVDDPKKTENGVEFPASDYAHVPDKHHPSTWKLRLTSEPGGKPDATHVGAAIAAISPKGYRGQRAEIPEDAMDGVKERLRAAWTEANPDKDPSEMPDHMAKSGDAPQSLGKRLIAALTEAVQKAMGEAPGARSYAEVSADTQTDDTQFQMIWDLREAIDSIIDDPDVADKPTAIGQTLDQFEAGLQPLIAQMNAAQKQGVQKFIAQIRKGATSEMGEPTNAPAPTDVEKAALEKRLQDAEQRAQRAEEVAKAERETRLTREAVAKAQTFDGLAVNAEEFGPVLKSLREKAPEETAKVEALLDAANAAVKKGALFAELGSAASGATDAETQINKAAEELRKANPALTKEQAFTKAMSDNPELYAAYRRQSA